MSADTARGETRASHSADPPRGSERLQFETQFRLLLVFTVLGLLWSMATFTALSAAALEATVAMWDLGLVLDLPVRLLLILALSCVRCGPRFRRRLPASVAPGELQLYSRSPAKAVDPLAPEAPLGILDAGIRVPEHSLLSPFDRSLFNPRGYSVLSAAERPFSPMFVRRSAQEESFE